MKLKKIINEIFVDYMRNRLNDATEIYLNPSKKEMNRLGIDIRFIAIKEGKKVYVFNAGEAIHKDLKRYLELEDNETILEGTAEKIGNEYILVGWHRIQSLFNSFKIYKDIDSYNKLKKVLFTDWTFINKYINVDRYLNNKKEKLKKIKT